MKNHKFFYFDEKYIKEKNNKMTYLKYFEKEYILDLSRLNECNAESPLFLDVIKKCIDIILQDDGKLEMPAIAGDREWMYVLRPSYKIAFNTLIDLQILLEKNLEGDE